MSHSEVIIRTYAGWDRGGIVPFGPGSACTSNIWVFLTHVVLFYYITMELVVVLKIKVTGVSRFNYIANPWLKWLSRKQMTDIIPLCLTKFGQSEEHDGCK